MLDMLGATQKQLLKELLKNKAGMTVDELSVPLSITRNAVRQHVAALLNDGLVIKAQTRASGGRPEQLYALSEQGHECFPRHYVWFAQLLVESVEREVGVDGMVARLEKMGTQVGTELLAQHPGLSDPVKRIEKLSTLMEQLGYDAHPAADGKGDAIEAHNCVFHTLAQRNPHVCRFDLALLGTFTGSTVEHQQCMAKGDQMCRFHFKEKDGAA
ncbi:helix-turn-helix transcriptional regulator [Massilia antarctica]|uniref:helix-turn-helix transcriptional regulator n=1 Tax=Massilia antarctica TaxID=2765360 RepID=UPI0006BB6EE8|nr:methanogen output domain 1-containing protein [Massilia sp. H27-R4]MCY0913625.1 methanogen output domain 1-containing protein [Massilia sp. H27-R4]CUI06029.1 Iron-sulfur cluster regulator SufR [Janthinobacterium sp. CG23_2]CUU29815.1 Iron-sulfur cluster regulator SufR [Janthinobacterium sp. CG23_2]